MGRWQPYQYNEKRTSQYDVPEIFNPKAVTMASRQPPSPRKKAEGPLVDFNRHPDSYLILPYGKTDAKPMNPKVKVWIKITRYIQLAFRVLTLLGAIGALLCAIFVRGAGLTEGYIIRIPPGVDIANTLYAIYHLLRSAKSRPAASSASYHAFAMVMDAGFIPLYVFTAILSRRNYNEEAGTNGRWRTFFPTDEETNKVLQTAWLTATTVAGLHCVSLVLDLYLLLVFRKISNLPPDMNPLEENLTSRRKTKHKHKNSSMSAIIPLNAQEDKRFSTQSGTTAVQSRYSQADTFVSEKEIPLPDTKAMSFMHTRTNSDMAYSPHTPNSARQSRSMYSQPPSARQSRGDLHYRDDLHRREDDDDNETLAQRKSLLAQQAIKRNSRPNTMGSSKEEFYTPPTTANKHGAEGDLSLQKDSRESLQSDNWFVYGDAADEDNSSQPPKASTHKGLPAVAALNTFRSKKGYNAVSSYDDVSDEEFETPMMPQPLRMNPPTPPPGKAYTPESKPTPPPPTTLQRTHTTTTLSSDATFSRSPSRPTTPGKSRYYGDLRAATQGIRNGQSPANSPGTSPTKNYFAPNSLPSATKQYTTNSPIAKTTTNAPFSLDKKSFTSVRRTGETGYTPVQGQSPRVVSRTGVDYDGRYDFDDSDLGTPGRRRDVSGKIAEEGRGGRGIGNWGMRANELTYRKVSGVQVA